MKANGVTCLSMRFVMPRPAYGVAETKIYHDKLVRVETPADCKPVNQQLVF